MTRLPRPVDHRIVGRHEPVQSGQVFEGRGPGLLERCMRVERPSPRRPRFRHWLLGVVAALLASLFTVVSPSATADPARLVAATSSPAGGGWTVTASGIVNSFGGAVAFGSVNATLRQPIVGIAATPDGGGYWLVATDGGVFSFGDAAFHGSAASLPLNRPVVGIAATPTGRGYWLVASDGGIFSYGDAAFRGSTGAMRLNAPIVGMAATRTGGGYWLVASDGGMFAFGDAAFRGSTGGMRLNAPIVGMAATSSGAGYWLVASDGGVFAFGDAGFAGSLAGTGASAIGIAGARPTGYWLIAADGSARLYGGTSQPSPSTVTIKPDLALLGADTAYLPQDTQAGVRNGVINVRWDLWEPQPGYMNPSFIREMQGAVAQYRAAGWTVSIDIGLQTPPAWVLNLPGGELQDQWGNRSGTANFVYNAAVRGAASSYIASIVSALPGVASFRAGLSETGEMLYPAADSNQWWAFDALAQGHQGGRPSTVPASPMPGWVPGTPSYQGQQVNPGMAQSWYDWYLGALIDAEYWQITAYRAAGYTGEIQLVMPGLGALPQTYDQRISDVLAQDPLDPSHTMNTGAVWWKVLDQLPLSGTAVDISSVGDTSGSPEANTCQASDGSVDYINDPTTIGSWSDTRWLAYLAGIHGLPVIGENGGYTPAGDLPAIMNLVGSCHLRVLQWAWDWSLNQPGNWANLAQVVGAMPIALAAAGQ